MTFGGAGRRGPAADRRVRALVGVLACLLAFTPAAGAPACANDEAAAPRRARLRQAMADGRFIAYAPTSITVADGRATPASAASIRADLLVLRPHFDGLITYGARNGAEAIPAIARELGFRALVVGVWDPFDDGEVEAALRATRNAPGLVVGIALGNEWQFARRPRAAELAARIAALKARAPDVPLATTEPFHVFDADGAAPLLGTLDFLLPNVHPVFQPWFQRAPTATAADFVANVLARLAMRFCGPILVKETGVPTAPAAAGFSEARQAEFYRALGARLPPTGKRAFAYFAAFDAPWRVADEQAAPGYHPEEAHWGLFDERRQPKPVVAAIPPLASRYSQ